MEYIITKIKEYNRIIIFRHTNPDLDALGSQIGLKEAILCMYPDKEVYVVGETNKFGFIGDMDEVNNDLFKDSLAIILDVAVSHLVSDDRYLLAKECIVIDHHNNDSDINAYVYKNTSYPACAELVFDFANKYLKINQKSATALIGGIITDTGRFLYQSVTSNTFNAAKCLLEYGADLQFIYNNLYTETIEERLMKNYFQQKYVIEDNIAYMKNDKDVFERFNIDTFSVSRGMVNIMSGITDIFIWANFTYDIKNDKILCELRSKFIKVIDIAKKYGGGGHDYACGATLNDWETVDLMIKDLKIRRREYDSK